MSSEDESRIAISNSRFVTVSKFKNKVRVDIREYFLNADGERKPGKKGISLSLDEWKKLKANIREIEQFIKDQGGEISDNE